MNDYLLNFVNKIVGIIAGLAISVILARALGVELRGELAFILQVAGIAAIILGMGVNQAFIRVFKLSGHADLLPQTMGVCLVQGLAGLAALLALARVWSSETWLYIAILAAALAVYQQVESVMAAFNIGLKIRVNLVHSTVRVVLHVAAVLAITMTLSVPINITVACALGSVVIYFIVGGAKPAVPSWTVARDLWGYGWLPMVSSLLMVMNYGVDIILLKMLGTPTDLGLYAVAAGMATYLWVIPDAIKEVLVSRIVRTADPRTVLLPLKAAVLSGAACIVGLVAVGPWMIPALFGQEYAESYPLIAVLSLGVLPMIYFKVLGVYVLADGRRWFYFLALAASVCLNVLINLVTIPAYGAIGAAWTTVITYSVTGVVFAIYFSRVMDIPMLRVVAVSGADLTRIVGAIRRRNK